MNSADMSRVFECARKYYSTKKLEHVMMVTKYVEDDPRFVDVNRRAEHGSGSCYCS